MKKELTKKELNQVSGGTVESFVIIASGFKYMYDYLSCIEKNDKQGALDIVNNAKNEPGVYSAFAAFVKLFGKIDVRQNPTGPLV